MRPTPSAPVSAAAHAEGRLGMAAALAAAIIYGAAYPATAVALRSFSPLAVAGLSCTLALVIVIGLVLVGILPKLSEAPMTAPRLARLACLGLLGGFLFIVGVNLAVAISGPTVTGFVAPLYAVLATLFAVPLLGERIRVTTLLAFALAFTGTAFLAGSVPTGDAILGVLLALAAAAMFGLYVVLARRWGRRYHLDASLVTIALLVARGPVLLVPALIQEPGRVLPEAPDPAAVIALLSIVFGASIAGNLLLMASVRRVPAGRTSAALLVTPVASAVIAALVVGERLSPAGIVGAALIVVGMAIGSGLLGWRRTKVELA